MPAVRTTLTLEPDVYSLIQRRLQTPGTTLKSVVNDAIRAGLTPRRREVFETQVAALGRPTVNLDHALRLAGELDDAATLPRLEMGA